MDRSEGIHEKYMKMALEKAKEAERHGEVPVGAVLVSAQGEILARTFNQPIGLCDPTAHAEILALREGAARIGNYRLTGSRLYVTIEPCVMCAGALVHARLAELVIGAMDPKAGACGSVFDIVNSPCLNHRVEVRTGILGRECKEIIQAFFRRKR